MAANTQKRMSEEEHEVALVLKSPGDAADLVKENAELKLLVAELSLRNRMLKRTVERYKLELREVDRTDQSLS